MSLPKLPPPSTLPSLPTTDRAAILDLLFEPSTQLHTLSLPLLTAQTFASYPDLIAAIGVQLLSLADSASTSDTQWLDSILGSHPRLGEKKITSAQSAAEQAQLQTSSASSAGTSEAEQLAQLNEEYERVFPGLRYVVFVNGRGRDVIMQDMRRRIEGGDAALERRTAITAMCEIAVDRAAKLSRG